MSDYKRQGIRVFHGECLDILRKLKDNSIDSVVTDPPYGLGFMGKKWDDLPPGKEVFEECLRVLKPGGHVVAFGGTRTYHRLAVAVEDAGFEIRDMMQWMYGQGFPKSYNIKNGIEKKAKYHPDGVEQWDGWGTALKPAQEPIVLARKPFKGSVADNVMKWGTGGLNIDDCRVGDEERVNTPAANKPGGASYEMSRHGMPQDAESKKVQGRHPANVILSYSEDKYKLRDDITPEELQRLSEWINEES